VLGLTMPLPPPSILLNHPKFSSWYPGQEDAFNQIDHWLRHSDKRFLCASMPTGSGKSLLGVLAAILGSKDTAFLTVTKGLQSQLMDDFEQLKMYSLVGGNNYVNCPDWEDLEGNVHGCTPPFHNHWNRLCEYLTDVLLRAENSKLIVTNYACYYYRKSGMGARDFVICAEAHMLFGEVEKFFSTDIYLSDLSAIGWETLPTTVAEPQMWIAKVGGAARARLREIEYEQAEYVDAHKRIPALLTKQCNSTKRLISSAVKIKEAGQRVYQYTNRGTSASLTVLWPDITKIFSGVHKVLLMSATLSTKTVDLLGIPPSSRDWLDVPSFFPASNSPIVRVKATRMNHRATTEDINTWLTRIDQIINKRLDRKGIIFGVSYKRCQDIVANSRHQGIMYLHNSKNVVDVVEKFKKAKAPAVLVSPTVTSGWDFPDTDCEYCIIGKLPYPDSRDPVVKARYEEDKDWGSYLAMQVLVQECGRGSRSEGDKCEYLIVDDNFGWFWQRYKGFAPKWFHDRVREKVLDTVPDVLI